MSINYREKYSNVLLSVYQTTDDELYAYKEAFEQALCNYIVTKSLTWGEIEGKHILYGDIITSDLTLLTDYMFAPLIVDNTDIEEELTIETWKLVDFCKIPSPMFGYEKE